MKNRMTGFVSILLPAVVVFVFGGSGLVLAQANCADNQIFTAKSCAGDGNSSEETALFQLVNKYRAANSRPALRLSTALSMVANRRMLDLKLNMKSLTHSWSNCPYDIKDEKTLPCLVDSPQRLNSGYKGQGYETLYRTTTGTANPDLAIESWKKSPLHSSIILNLGMFKDMAWDEVGVAIDGGYAALWFGYPGTDPKPVVENSSGLGVSFDQAVAGLSKIVSITETPSAARDNKWQGSSADKKIKIEILGTSSEIREVVITVASKLETSGKLGPQSRLALLTLLRNLFPEWVERESWLDIAAKGVSMDDSAYRTKTVRSIAIDLRSDGGGSLKLTVRPK